jgi:CRISPR/Cas system CSM-associated protein Csm4 (group 5 of RAMP superfamily)
MSEMVSWHKWHFFHQDPPNSLLLILRGQEDFLIRMLNHSDQIFDSVLEQILQLSNTHWLIFPTQRLSACLSSLHFLRSKEVYLPIPLAARSKASV